jgi:hypothetical protein
MVVLLLLAFVGGFIVGNRPVGELNQRVATAEATARESVDRVAELEARVHAFRALSLLYMTLVDVDDRNFGIANTRLDQSVSALDQVDPGRIDVDTGELEAIRSELADLDIRVAADLADQRDTLAELARRLAEVLGA